MKIAFLGSRGIPARYSGFETFYEALATRLADRGHSVTVYNRAHFIPEVKRQYKNVEIVRLPCIPTKHLETLTHTFLSTLHALFQRYDIVYYCIVGNAPLVWLPRVMGASTLLNVDGADWAREKWSGFATWYQKWCERVATFTPSVVVADAHVIQERYLKEYRKQSVYVPYGADLQRDEGTEHVTALGLVPDNYVLYVGRFVPENAIDLLIRAFKRVATDKKLAIIGDAPYSAEYKEQLHAIADDRVVFTGYQFGDVYRQLSSHAYLYVQPSGIEGTRPALLDQLGFGNCVLVRDGKANLQVVADAGASFDGSNAENDLTAVLQRLVNHPDERLDLQGKARDRIRNYYNWETVTSFHEDLFQRLQNRSDLISFDDYLLQQTP